MARLYNVSNFFFCYYFVSFACVCVLKTAFSYVKNAFLLLLSRIKDRVGSYFTERKSWHFRSLIIRLGFCHAICALHTPHPYIGQTKRFIYIYIYINRTVCSAQKYRKINVWLPLNCTRTKHNHHSPRFIVSRSNELKISGNGQRRHHQANEHTN